VNGMLGIVSSIGLKHDEPFDGGGGASATGMGGGSGAGGCFEAEKRPGEQPPLKFGNSSGQLDVSPSVAVGRVVLFNKTLLGP
jgi:hypothetical protein